MTTREASEILQDSIASKALRVLRLQAEIIEEITDLGNEDLPVLIANGAQHTLLWAVEQLEKEQELLERKAAQDVEPEAPSTAVM